MKTQGQVQVHGYGGDGDYVDSCRVIAADAGHEAFNCMVAAVNSADERVNFIGEL